MRILLIGDRGPLCLQLYRELTAANHEVVIRRIDRLTPMQHLREVACDFAVLLGTRVVDGVEVELASWGEAATVGLAVTSTVRDVEYTWRARRTLVLELEKRTGLLSQVRLAALVGWLVSTAAESVSRDDDRGSDDDTAGESKRVTLQPAAVGPVPERVRLRAQLMMGPDWTWPTAPCHVSVLVGSYNRFSMLVDFVQSVRANLSANYEIVVADGGSTDETLAWLTKQADCRVVHAGLTGAIDAFNLAYEASCGAYVFYANDDTVVVGDGLKTAVEHLDAQPACPGIAFEFKTPKGSTWGCPRFNAEFAHPNVALLRREVVEACIAAELGALWGDREHRVHKTYFGDTYLGVVLAKLGYRVHVSPAHRVVDRMPADALRKMNKSAERDWKVMNATFDTMSGRGEGVFPRIEVSAWQDALVPLPGRLPERSPIGAGPPERILIVPAGQPEGSMADAARALSACGESRVVFSNSPDWVEQMYAAAKELQPTLIWMQVQVEHHGAPPLVAQLRRLAPGAFITSWNGDLTIPAGGYAPWQDRFLPCVDLALVTNCDHPARIMLRGCPAAGYLPIGWDSPEVDLPLSGEAQQDSFPIVFTGTGYPQRVSLLRPLRERIAIYGHSWPAKWRVHDPVEMRQVGGLYRSAVGVICSSIRTTLRRYTSDRLKRVLGCGGLAMVEAFSDYEGLGLRDGVNCLVWRDQEELAAMLDTWSTPERAADRQRIREAGQLLAHTTMRWADTLEHLLAAVRRVRRFR